ncbi:MAG: hypothetical protein ACRC1D_00030 [Culicoidibacterales bacterium]
MIKKLMELKTAYHVLILFLLNALAVAIYFTYGTQWNTYLLAGVLVAITFIYFAMWSIALIRARFDKKNGFFIGSIIYWVMMLSVVASAFTGLAANDPNLALLNVVATGAFIGMALFGGMIAIAPLVIMGLIATIFFWRQMKLPVQQPTQQTFSQPTKKKAKKRAKK